MNTIITFICFTEKDEIDDVDIILLLFTFLSFKNELFFWDVFKSTSGI